MTQCPVSLSDEAIAFILKNFLATFETALRYLCVNNEATVSMLVEFMVLEAIKYQFPTAEEDEEEGTFFLVLFRGGKLVLDS